MAKWNPESSVNAKHLLNIIRKGDKEYLDFIALLAASGPGEDEVQNGVDRGYLPSDAMAIMYPTPERVEEVKEAASNAAQVTMIAGLMKLGQDTAVQVMLDQGMVTEDQIAAACPSLAG